MEPNLAQLKRRIASIDYSGDQHSSALVKETALGATLKTVHIQAGNGDWFLFHPDKLKTALSANKVMSPLLALGDGLHHHKACDALLVALVNGVLWAVHIELKSNNPKGYREQFQSTKRFYSYLLGVTQEFDGIAFANTRERYVLFHTNHMSLSKTTTVASNQIPPSSDPRNPSIVQVMNGQKFPLNAFLK